MNKIKQMLSDIYPGCDLTEFDMLMERWGQKGFDHVKGMDHSSVYMITYGDAIHENGVPSLQTLKKFADRYLSNIITDIHILPMFEYTSDDGFSVVDYRKIDPALGNWEDIDSLRSTYRLMFDFVCNHMSKSSEAFQAYLDDRPEYRDWFIEKDGSFDSSKVTRPRTSPLFHAYRNGHEVWTTFSEDQVDLNFSNYKVFLAMTDILLDYAYRGATSIRLDAVGFMWKESGTTCMHLKQVHEVVKIWRAILDEFKPNCQIITETNVPHKENISYLGDHDEANMVYQFALPPMVLYSFISGNAQKLSEWASMIDVPGEKETYFNFLSSHDGIGLRPTEGILDDEERQKLVDRVLENGGRVSYKQNQDGSKSVYELNINYHDALVDEQLPVDVQIKMIEAANAILFGVVGVPAIYYNTLLGSRNYTAGVEESGINRRINREKFEYDSLCADMENNSWRKATFAGIQKIINSRQKSTAFDPYAEQKVLDYGSAIFAIERKNRNTGESARVLVNVTNRVQEADGVELQPYEWMYLYL